MLPKRAGKPRGERKFGQTQSSPADYCRSPQADRWASATAGRGAFEPLPPEGGLRGIARSAFRERCKIHDLVMQGIEMALKKRGYPPVEELKAGKKR
jgi:hypothetical protein